MTQARGHVTPGMTSVVLVRTLSKEEDLARTKPCHGHCIHYFADVIKYTTLILELGRQMRWISGSLRPPWATQD